MEEPSTILENYIKWGIIGPEQSNINDIDWTGPYENFISTRDEHYESISIWYESANITEESEFYTIDAYNQWLGNKEVFNTNSEIMWQSLIGKSLTQEQYDDYINSLSNLMESLKLLFMVVDRDTFTEYNCDRISVTYTLVAPYYSSEDPVTVVLEKNRKGNYYLEIDGNSYQLISDGTQWIFKKGVSNLYFVVSDFSTNAAFSNNTLLWNYSNIGVSYLYAITFGGLFVAVGSNGKVLTFSGKNQIHTYTGFSDNFTDVVYGLKKYIAITNSGDRFHTSNDGINWSYYTVPSYNWSGIAFGDNTFVVVSADSIGVGGRVMTSIDGVNWIQRSPSAPASWKEVSYRLGRFVAISFGNYMGINGMYSTNNGVSWLNMLGVSLNLISVTSSPDYFVAIGTDGDSYKIATSSNGTSWDIISSLPTIVPQKIRYIGGKYIVVGSNGIATSSNLLDWETYVTDSANLSDVALGISEEVNQATLSSDAPCPFGDYTMVDGSIFSAFEVTPI